MHKGSQECAKTLWHRQHDVNHSIDRCMTFPLQCLRPVKWYSRSGSHSSPAVLVGIGAAVPHASLKTCSSCQLAEGPAPPSPHTPSLESKPSALWLSEETRKAGKIHTARWHTNTHIRGHTCAHPFVHTRTFTRSDTPARAMCSGGGAASVGMRRWTAFEPTTSVTHPYWWRTESSLTAQRFSGHSVAPGTTGVNGRGRCGVADGWMNGGLDRQVQNISSQVYLWNKPRESEKYELTSVFGGVLNGVTSNWRFTQESALPSGCVGQFFTSY